MNFICLVYHRVTNDPAAQVDPFTVTPACLRAQMDWLARRGYQGVSISEALADSGRRRPVVALAFDDGARDFYATAWPILRRFNFGATLFVVTNRAGKPADWPEAQGAPLLSWAEARQLADQGVEIGVHGAAHRPLDGMETAVLQSELQSARQTAVEELGREPVGLAYPYGRYSPAVIRAAQAAGFTWAATARGGKNGRMTNLFALRRTLITGRDGSGWRFAFKVRTGYAKLVEWRMDLRRIE